MFVPLADCSTSADDASITHAVAILLEDGVDGKGVEMAPHFDSMRRMRLFLPVLGSSVLVLVLACRSSDPAGTSAPTASAVSAVRAAPSAPIAAPERTTAAAASAATPSSAAPSSSAAAASSAAAPEGPPTSEEWETAKEVTVTGSTALGCETKRVREWVRVLCAKPNDAAGTPVGVKLKKAEVLQVGEVQNHRKNVKTSSEEGSTMLMAKYVEGADVEAVFSWTDKEKLLVLWWPTGKPEPRQVGAFK
jgi:hypothetical protein